MVNLIAPWVWTFGYGLMTFIMRAGNSLANDLNQILEPSNTTARVIGKIERSTMHKFAWPYTVPITILGVLLTFMYRVPHYGLSYVLISLGIISIYYVGAFLLFHFVEVTTAFHMLLEDMTSVTFNRLFSPLHLDNVISYLSITTILGTIAIYCGFRGTLTAGFDFHHEVWRFFLTTPLILFLPATFFYNFYPRYVLRKVLQYKLLHYMTSIVHSEVEDIKSLVADIRDVATVYTQMLPFVDYKSLPSYIVAILFVISLVYNHDPILKSFFVYLLGLGSGSN